MTTTAKITEGATMNHSWIGIVRVIAVEKRGVLVAVTTGREGFRTTREERVAKRDLHPL